jgi:hypothetical protein
MAILNHSLKLKFLILKKNSQNFAKIALAKFARHCQGRI